MKLFSSSFSFTSYPKTCGLSKCVTWSTNVLFVILRFVVNCVRKHPCFSSNSIRLRPRKRVSSKKLFVFINFSIIILIGNGSWLYVHIWKDAKKETNNNSLKRKMFKQFTCKSWFIHFHTHMIYFYLFIFHEKNIIAYTWNEKKKWARRASRMSYLYAHVSCEYAFQMNINSITNVWSCEKSFRKH